MANLTLVNSNRHYDPTNVTESFAIPGLSDSANLVGYVDRGPLKLRLSLAWRDEYLQQIGQPVELAQVYEAAHGGSPDMRALLNA